MIGRTRHKENARPLAQSKLQKSKRESNNTILVRLQIDSLLQQVRFPQGIPESILIYLHLSRPSRFGLQDPLFTVSLTDCIDMGLKGSSNPLLFAGMGRGDMSRLGPEFEDKYTVGSELTLRILVAVRTVFRWPADSSV
jgi:hypothetical protein